MNSIRTKIIAVAKDEGAYLAEWIFHHLYKGFDEIEILINRTTDNSREIVERISKRFPQVSYTNSDFVDWVPGSANKKFQYLAYANALERTLNDTNKCVTHIMFLDIDEFWVHEDVSVTISDYLGTVPQGEGVSFSWLNEYPKANAFEMLDNTFIGERSRLVKSIFPVTNGIKKVRLHQPLLKQNRYINVDTTPWEEDPNISEHSKKSIYSPAFICHRLFRSPMEYVSTLATGRMSGAEIPFKTNRHGLPRARKESLVTVVLEHEQWLSYESKRREFMEELDLEQLRLKSQKFVEERYLKSISYLSSFLSTHHKPLLKLFANVSCKEVENAFIKHHDELVSSYVNNVEKIRDLAISCEHYSLKEARRLMQMALKLRPEGPRIIEKLKYYDNELANSGIC
ncbi:conserved hypothetical protein [Alteromonas alvinellae]